MSLLSSFFLNSAPNIVQLDLLEITHTHFSNTYRLCRNSVRDIAVTHEGPAGPFTYIYQPMRIRPVGSGADLGQQLAVTLGDLGDVISREIANVTAANKMNIRPVVKFRTYRSDSLGAPMSGPLILEIAKVTTSEEGCSFECRAPELNNTRTGVLYSVEIFPMIRGFLA